MHGRIGNWKTKADPLLESLIAWLEKQPADGVYCPYTPESCMLGQFAVAMGSLNPRSASMRLATQKGLERAAYWFEVGDPEGFTFGDALSRAKAALAVQS